MTNKKEHEEVIRNHNFTEDDCKACLINAERLLDDASNESLSGQTRMVLVELSFEELAKSFLLLDHVMSDDKGQSLVEGKVEDALIDIFQYHKTKIKIMKELLSDIAEDAENTTAPDVSKNFDYVEKVLQLGTEGEDLDLRDLKISTAKQIFSSEASFTPYKIVAKNIIDFLNIQGVEYYNDLKNKSLYVDLDVSTDRLLPPMEPKNDKMRNHMMFFIITQLVFQWFSFEEEEKAANLIKKYKNKIAELIKWLL